MQLAKVQKVEAILEANLATGNPLVLGEVPERKTEALYLNLLKISFPDTLFVADLNVDLKKSARARERAFNEDRPYSRRPPKRPPAPRERVIDFLHEQELKFAVDWEYHAGQIVTFHNLEDELLPLRRAIEPGTVTSMHPEEFFEQGDDEENVFRSLLRRCLQQKLYPRSVLWQHEAKLFIFCPEDGEELRQEEWVGKKKNPPREVYKLVKKDPKKIKKRPDGGKPNPILYHKHLAFETQFLQFGDQWYLLIRPDWYFSSNGYRPSFYGADNVAWIKRHEANQSVFNYLRFLVYFLNNDKPSTLFKQYRPYRFLSLGQMITLDRAPKLEDADWLPTEGKGKRKRLNDLETDNLQPGAVQVSSLDFDEDDETDEE